MTTTIQQMTVRSFHAAAVAMTMGAMPDVSPMRPSDIRGWAGVVHGDEAIDGTHRAAALGAWAAEHDGWDEMVPVVVTDDGALVVALLDAHDAGRDVTSLIESALAA